MSFPSFSFFFNPELLSKTRGWVNTHTLSNLIINKILTQPPPKRNNSPTCLKVIESSNSTCHKANLKWRQTYPTHGETLNFCNKAKIGYFDDHKSQQKGLEGCKMPPTHTYTP